MLDIKVVRKKDGEFKHVIIEGIKYTPSKAVNYPLNKYNCSRYVFKYKNYAIKISYASYDDIHNEVKIYNKIKPEDHKYFPRPYFCTKDYSVTDWVDLISSKVYKHNTELRKIVRELIKKYKLQDVGPNRSGENRDWENCGINNNGELVIYDYGFYDTFNEVINEPF